MIAPMKAMVRLVVAAGALLFSSTLWAGPGSAHLHKFLAQLSSLQADFRQVLLNDEGQAEDESNGQVYLSRPGRFRWDYVAPHPQVIVADGKEVWLYDEELSQVTVRAQAKALDDTPAALLASTAPVEDSFNVTELGERDDGNIWLSLTPKSTASNFDGIMIGFGREGELKLMQLKDAFGQTTRLEFSAIERNPTLDESLFVFTPPTGADVIRSQ